MSKFSGQVGGYFQTTQQANDPRLQSQQYIDVEFEGYMDYSTNFWPRSSHALGDQSVDYGPEKSMWYGRPDLTHGQNTRYNFKGVCRDVNGLVVSSCTVSLYRTSDNLLVDSVTASAAGVFDLSTPYYPDTHYIVAYNVSSAVEGTTVNTLVGA